MIVMLDVANAANTDSPVVAPQATHQIDIEPSALHTALRQLARQTGIQLAHFTAAVPGSLRAKALHGTYTVEEALGHLLEGTGLTYRFANERTVVIIEVARPLPTDAPSKPVSRAHRGNWLARLAALFAACGAGTGVVCAEESGPAVSDVKATQEPQIQEITVTARRREERQQDVPISIAAFGQEQIQQRQLQSEVDLQLAVPGLVIRQNGSANQFNYVLRGQSVDTYSNSPPGVLPYINEAQIITRSATMFYDLSSIQVLKGPQGTLFGRNAIGGAVLFETAKPGDESDGYVRARYGNYELAQIESAASLPFGGIGGLRIAGAYVHGGAFVRNLTGDVKLGKQDVASGRITLTLKPFERLTNVTVAQYTDEGGNNVPTEVHSAYSCGETFKGVSLNATVGCTYDPATPIFQAYIAAHPNKSPGGAVAEAAAQRERGPWVSDIQLLNYHDASSAFVINTTTFDVLSDLSIKNIFLYNNSKADDGFDYDGTQYPIYQTGGTPTVDGNSVSDPHGYIQTTRQISDELQLQGEAFGGRLDYVIGAYYLSQRDINDSSFYAFDFSPIFPGFAGRYHQRTKNESKAVFGQGTFSATDRLNVTFGLRHTWEVTTARQLPGSVWRMVVDNEHLEELKSDKPSWTASLDYRLGPSLLVYAAHRGSWRTGGFNYTVEPINTTAADGGNRFNPETIKDVEVGLKYAGDELGIPITVNSALYTQWVKDVQRAAYILGVGGQASLVTTNVPKAKISGVDVDFSLHPAAWLTLGGSLAYTDARYTDRRVVLSGTMTTYGPYADAPKWSGSLFLETFHKPGSLEGELTLHIDVYAQSKLYFSNVAETLAPYTAIDGYELLNGRLTWSGIRGSGLSASLFVRNLLDKEYYAGGNSMGPTIGLNTSVPGRPRMWGAELQFRF